jgi:hypothetical protein
MPETPPPIIKTSNIIIDCRSFFFNFLDILKSKELKQRKMKLNANGCYHAISLKRMTKI